MESRKYAAVVVDLAVPKSLDYEIPAHLIQEAAPGARVKVPLRGKLCPGTILELKLVPEISRTSFIEEILPASLPPDLLKLGVWISNYYCTPFFKVLKQLLPPPIRQEMEEKQQLFIKSLLSKPELALICEKKKRPSKRDFRNPSPLS